MLLAREDEPTDAHRAPTVRSRVNLRARVAILFAALVLLLAAILSMLIGQSSVDQARARIGQSLATDAARIADRLNKEMASRSRELALLAAMDPLRNQGDAGAMQSLLDTLRRNQGDYFWLVITDVHGRVVTATDGSLLGNDLSTRADIQSLLRNRPSRLDDAAMRTTRAGTAEALRPEEPRMMTISRPIRAPDGTAVGLIVAQLSWDWAREVSRTLLTPDADGVMSRQAFVVSNTDMVLVGPPHSVGTRLSLPAVNRARAGIFGWSVDAWPDDSEPYLIGAAFAAGEGQFPGPGTVPMGWTVLVRETQAAAFAPAEMLRETIFISGLALSLAVAALGWLLVGYIMRPLRQITVAADRLRCGETIDLPQIRGAPEIETLSASLRALVATLTSKQIELDELETTSQLDPLTGLMNRAGLHMWLQASVVRARHERLGLLVLVGDLDGFKQVNDTFGHAAGDTLLQDVAARLKASVRSGDAVARLGGDEFVLVLNAPLGHADHAAIETAYRVWSRVMEPYTVGNTTIMVGLSLGAASWPEDGLLPEAVVNKADAALYGAKRAGKAQIMFHREPAMG